IEGDPVAHAPVGLEHRSDLVTVQLPGDRDLPARGQLGARVLGKGQDPPGTDRADSGLAGERDGGLRGHGVAPEVNWPAVWVRRIMTAYPSSYTDRTTRFLA